MITLVQGDISLCPLRTHIRSGHVEVFVAGDASRHVTSQAMAMDGSYAVV